jgi:ribokinase
MSGRVIVVGSVNIDLVARVPHLPHPGETVTGGSFERHHGGKGGNQAVAAARLRRPTLFIGAVGDDTFEIEARRALSSERVDVSMVASLPGQPTGVALILVDATGENQIAVVPGANGAIESGYVRDCLARLGPLHGDVMLVCNEVPLHVVREALMCGAAAGATTILNPAPAIGIDRSIFGLADIVTPNRNELATLLQTEASRTGRRVDASTEAAVRARSLLEPGPDGPGVRKAVIVTLGASGVVVLERAGWGLSATVDIAPADAAPADAEESGATDATAPPAPAAATPAAPAPTPAPAARTSAGRRSDLHVWEVSADRVATVDSTGAGDAFCGALAAALAEGRPLAEAVERAVAGGALATTRVGAREGMPTFAELEEFLGALGFPASVRQPSEPAQPIRRRPAESGDHVAGEGDRRDIEAHGHARYQGQKNPAHRGQERHADARHRGQAGLGR